MTDLFTEYGGTARCRELAEAFYGRVARDAVLRPLFPGKSMHCPIEELTAFLVQILGGPGEDAQRRWWLSLRESHARFRIGEREREAWLGLMAEALEETKMPAELRGFFVEAAGYLVPGCSGEVGGELERRWAEQRAVDALVAAARAGDVELVERLAAGEEVRACFGRSRFVMAHFVGLLMAERMGELAGRLLQENRDLVRTHYAGRTLLHEAARIGDVELLLRLGAPVDELDDGGHTALYWAGNGCEHGGGAVRALIAAGADVNACEGVKRCTPLHMAARRGFVETAEALLDCGANVEARDSAGETPLRRAVNCEKVEVARLLLARGANRHSACRKGLTPVSAVRTPAMRAIFDGLK